MMAFWIGTKEKGRTEESSELSLLDSAPSANCTTDDSGQVLGLAPNRTRRSAAAATSADQQQLPLSLKRPKLIGKARPATNGIRTSTKYLTKIAEDAGKVNLRKH
jgi:hypothetical protein